MTLRTISIVLIIAAVASAADYRTHGGAKLPDQHATPGAVDPHRTAKQLCDPAFHTGAVRNVTRSEKTKAYATYGARQRANVCCEVDHLISLELGGSNDIENLWPQPYSPRPGAHEKDVLENWMHRQVCSGAMTLDDAQRAIAEDWYAAYEKMRAAKRSRRQASRRRYILGSFRGSRARRVA
jgi:hypothetical protein